jgi:hypothetical protein
MREEAIYCLSASPAMFRWPSSPHTRWPRMNLPRILAALVPAGGSPALRAEAIRSPTARSRRPPLKPPRIAGPRRHTPEGPERADATLRFAEAQVKQGNASEALALYKTLLDDPTSHVQCAAVIGLSTLRSGEAAAAIMPKLKSTNPTVRITAQKAWKSMA